MIKDTMNKTIFYLCLAATMLVTTLTSCSEDNDTMLSDIRIGREAQLNEVSISRQTTRNILLDGGNGKYAVYVANPQIATAKIVNDTLKLTGQFEGTTFATIRSHDFEKRLDIKVVPPTLGFSQKHIRLAPKNESTSVTLTGGGIVNFEIDDPDQAVSVKWNAANRVVELRPRYEGEAVITAVGQDGTRDKLTVTVSCEGELNRIGYYSTRSKVMTTELNTRMVVRNRKTGTSLFGSVDPKNGQGLRLSPIINPRQGQTYDVTIAMLGLWPNPKLSNGTLKLKVLEVRPDKHLVVLRGPGFKFLLPYYDN